MIRSIIIDGREVPFRATASTVARYGRAYGTDFIKDLTKIFNAYQETGALDASVLEIFAKIAHTMAKQADPNIPDDVWDWVDGFEVFPINDIFPQLMALWTDSTMTSVESKNAVSAGQ